MHETQLGIDIAAPPNQVWAILTDFAAYPEWNPFIVAVRGQAVGGRALNVDLRTADGRVRGYWPHVLVSEPPRRLRWEGRLLPAGLLDGRQRFSLVGQPDGSTRFEQSVRFGGLLAPLLRTRLDTLALQGFEAMNRALKERAEAGA